MKLRFKKTKMNDSPCWLCEPYKIVCYGFSHITNKEIPTYHAYIRIWDKYSKSMLFGDNVNPNKAEFYELKEAQKACQDHFDKRS